LDLHEEHDACLFSRLGPTKLIISFKEGKFRRG
jgi:hypothetical protein